MSSVFVDQSLACASCGHTFIFSAGEQELQHLRGIRQVPGCCSACAQRLRRSGRRPSTAPASAAGANGCALSSDPIRPTRDPGAAACVPLRPGKDASTP